MDINRRIQYNQGVGKYKLLSSNAGVGSIITTKMGYFVMPLNVKEWKFLSVLERNIKEALKKAQDNNIKKIDFKSIADGSYVELIDDSRFVNFLKSEQDLSELNCLVSVPHVSLNEQGYLNIKKHPLNLKFQDKEQSNKMNLSDERFYVPAIHFPRWFYSKKGGHLKDLADWQNLWYKNKCNGGDLEYFSPPRDPNDKFIRTYKENKGKKNEVIRDIFRPLTQVPMVLICENGHISDIPWYQLFCALLKKEKVSDDNGFHLFEYNCCDCSSGGLHELQWIENRNQSESWGILKCSKCKVVVSLEGIMNIKPFCKAETPWNGIGSYQDSCKDSIGSRSKMRFALATSNSVYYADSFSSLYIPQIDLNANLPDLYKEALSELDRLLTKKREKDADCSKSQLLDTYEKGLGYKIRESAEIEINDEEEQEIKRIFLTDPEVLKNSYEQYRFDEYQVFCQNKKLKLEDNKLIFEDIDLPKSLDNYFNKIQQVSTLTVTSTQLSFNRLKMPEVQRTDDGFVKRNSGQTIFCGKVENLYALPANQVYGEGIFFDLNIETIDLWIKEHENCLTERFINVQTGELGKSLSEEMKSYCINNSVEGFAKFYLLHTFSHIIMKELEFSCGYPTSSLKERLYYSDRMCGVLIYTAEGSEGSMGGLVWQAQPYLIERIIYKSLFRAEKCTSDPLCWESDDQINLAACFSCCLVSEISCEQRNLGLDRRTIIDENFGFFKSMLH